jgi:tRNA pseudouridine38-40 synthase
MRFALGVEYDGSDFSGWETQPAQRTVQSSLESALSSVADSPVSTICAGRTDAGVHALGQVVHFDSAAERAPHEWVRGANSNLPDDVCVRWALPVGDAFHARYSANRRYYRYLIYNGRERSALLRRRAAWERGPLDVAPMQAACAHLLGERDFTSFRAAGCQAKNPVRTVASAEVTRRGDLVAIDIAANQRGGDPDGHRQGQARPRVGDRAARGAGSHARGCDGTAPGPLPVAYRLSGGA